MNSADWICPFKYDRNKQWCRDYVNWNSVSQCFVLVFDFNCNFKGTNLADIELYEVTRKSL